MVLDRGFRRGPVGDIEGVRLGRPAGGADRLEGLLQRVFAASHGGNRCAFRRQGQRDGFAQPTASAG